MRWINSLVLIIEDLKYKWMVNKQLRKLNTVDLISFKIRFHIKNSFNYFFQINKTLINLNFPLMKIIQISTCFSLHALPKINAILFTIQMLTVTFTPRPTWLRKVCERIVNLSYVPPPIGGIQHDLPTYSYIHPLHLLWSKQAVYLLTILDQVFFLEGVNRRLP